METPEEVKKVELLITLPLPDCKILPGIKKRAKLKAITIRDGKTPVQIQYTEEWLSADNAPFRPQFEGMPSGGDIAITEIPGPNGETPVTDKFKEAIAAAAQEFFQSVHSFQPTKTKK